MRLKYGLLSPTTKTYANRLKGQGYPKPQAQMRASEGMRASIDGTPQFRFEPQQEDFGQARWSWDFGFFATAAISALLLRRMSAVCARL